ncbi:MAG: hypothetical protein AAGA56_14865 [Myxococcota bacterium]
MVLDSERAAAIRQRLEHPFELMFEAIRYRLSAIVAEDIRLFDLVPEREYRSIRIYVSQLSRIRSLMSAQGDRLGYVSFIGTHRSGVQQEVEEVDRTLVRLSSPTAPILGYFSLQDPRLAWINLVLFDDLEAIAEWVRATHHADDWSHAASFFHAIDKSLGWLDTTKGSVTLEPSRAILRDYDAA